MQILQPNVEVDAVIDKLNEVVDCHVHAAHSGSLTFRSYITHTGEETEFKQMTELPRGSLQYTSHPNFSHHLSNRSNRSHNFLVMPPLQRMDI